MCFVRILFPMLNQATAKNDQPVMIPENGGANCTRAVITPGVCIPETPVCETRRNGDLLQCSEER